ncbi:MAG: hypothetical protein ACHQLQ_13285 [Candidatus Acidiferrales bacterium]
MALDDRERSFEKALARRLRANAAAAACPDAETLASYHERSLTAEEMNAWKQHTAACSNCQEILAQLEATDAIPVGAGEGQNAGVEGSNLFEAVYVEEQAPQKTKMMAAPVPLRRTPKHSRSLHWRWLAPVGALAAGLLVWIAVHERQPATPTQPAKIEVAENRPSSPPQSVATPATVEGEKAEKLASSSKETTATDKPAAASGVPQNRKAEPAPKEAAALSKGAFAKLDRKDAQAAVVAQSPQGVTESVAVGGAADALRSKQPDELPMQRREAANLVQLPAPPAKPTASGPAPLPQTDSKTMKKAPLPPAAPETALELSSGLREGPAFRMAKSRSPHAVPAPGGKVIWRLGMAGLIEQSTDGGLTWTPQTSGVTADLFLGSAPSEQVCWVIGDGGTILRTADGGAHWISVASPISQNLHLIRASGALHATVWDASRRNSFKTDDGGVTWTQVSSQ